MLAAGGDDGLGALTDGVVTNQSWFDVEDGSGSGPCVGWRTGPGGSEGRAVIDPDVGSGPSWLSFEGLDIQGASSVSVQFIHANE